MNQQREDGRETLRLTALAHEAHAQVDVVLGRQVNSRTGNLRTVEKNILKKMSDVRGPLSGNL